MRHLRPAALALSILLATPAALAGGQCPPPEPHVSQGNCALIDIVYANGMDTSIDQAIAERNELLNRVAAIPLTVQFRGALAYDSDDVTLLGQLLIAWEQKPGGDWSSFWNALGDFNNAPQWFKDKAYDIGSVPDIGNLALDPSLQCQVGIYESELQQGNALLVVAHSQGNLYSNAAYDLLHSESDGFTPLGVNAFSIVSLANPDSRVAGGGPWTTLPEDRIITTIALLAANFPSLHLSVPLPAGAPNVDQSTEDQKYHHAFLDSYLWGDHAGPEILNNISAGVSALTSPLGMPFCPRCQLTETCDNGKDDNCDSNHLVDCADPQCFSDRKCGCGPEGSHCCGSSPPCDGTLCCDISTKTCVNQGSTPVCGGGTGGTGGSTSYPVPSLSTSSSPSLAVGSILNITCDLDSTHAGDHAAIFVQRNGTVIASASVISDGGGQGSYGFPVDATWLESHSTSSTVDVSCRNDAMPQPWTSSNTLSFCIAPTTCAFAGFDCGTPGIGCGGTLQCGNCKQLAATCKDQKTLTTFGSPECSLSNTCTSAPIDKPCPNGCSKNKCCMTTCPAGATQCAPGGIQTCADPDGDGCFDWSTAQACQDGGSCEGGTCPSGTGGTTGAGGSPGTGGSALGGASGSCTSNCGAQGFVCQAGDESHQYLCNQVMPGCFQLGPAMACNQTETICLPGTSGCQNCGAVGQPCCSSATQCSTGSCAGGTCVAAPSCPATKNCSGRVCGPDPVCGLSCGTCNANQACSSSTGQCLTLACTPGALYCMGNERRQCSGDGLSSSLIETCPFTCAPGGCQPQCTGDANCLTTQFCQSGACVTDVCTQGLLYCANGNTEVWQCNTNGSAGTYVETCSSGCAAGSCSPQCTDDTGCAPSQYCAAGGTCMTDVCPQGKLFCSTATEQSQCNANGSMAADIQSCQYGCDAASASCKACPADCTGKCGGASDGCTGTCTSCTSGQICQGTTCVGDPCTPDPCNGHGTCAGGSCTCAGQYGGLNCQSCAPGYATDYPTCTPLCSSAAPKTIATGGFGSSAATYNGSGYGVIYQQAKLAFELLDATGAPIGSPTVLPEYGDYPGVAWVPPLMARYGLTWMNAGAAKFQCVDQTGALVGTSLRMNPAGSSANSSAIASNGAGQFGLAWIDNRSGSYLLYFNVVDGNTCATVGADTKMTTIAALKAIVAMGSTQYGVAWVDSSGTPGLSFSRLDENGKLLGTTPITTGTVGDLVPTAFWNQTYGEWAIVWNDRPAGETSEQLYFARVDQTGSKLGSTVKLTAATANQEYAQLTGAGDYYGLYWLDQQSNVGRFQRFDHLGAAASPALAVAGQAVGSVAAASGGSFANVFQPGSSEMVTCQLGGTWPGPRASRGAS